MNLAEHHLQQSLTAWKENTFTDEADEVAQAHTAALAVTDNEVAYQALDLGAELYASSPEGMLYADAAELVSLAAVAINIGVVLPGTDASVAERARHLRDAVQGVFESDEEAAFAALVRLDAVHTVLGPGNHTRCPRDLLDDAARLCLNIEPGYEWANVPGIGWVVFRES